MSNEKTGAEIVVKSLIDQGVEVVFGYPGGSVLPIYDELFKHSDKIRHVLVRQEGGAIHAAQGYARSSGKVGCALVTSGPGATNAVTGLTDAMLDSIPVVCLTGQVPTFLIGTDAFQEADTTGITRACTKYNYLVRDVEKLSHTIHEAFYIAKSGRPGPVVVDIPKDVQFANGGYLKPEDMSKRHSYCPPTSLDEDSIAKAVELMKGAKKPIFYTGGGVINAGANKLLRDLVKLTGFPITSTLMGLGAYPASGKNWVGMLGMHGTYEANMAMHDCDVMICIGARFDDRVTGLVEKFSPNSKKIHIDVDKSSVNKNIQIDIPIVADAGDAMKSMISAWKKNKAKKPNIKSWISQIDEWRARDCLAYKQTGKIIKPQFALDRLKHHLKGRSDVFISTEVGQHQMWTAQFMPFEEPGHFMTSGGLGTMGYGLPAAIGTQMANPDGLVIDIAGDASILMNIQEMSTAVQYCLPVKIFILNNQWMGMVRQWQELLHGERYSQSYTESLPDFVKLAEAYGGVGLIAHTTDDLDDVIEEMTSNNRLTIVDVRVDEKENCFPMIPSGKAHNEMIFSPDSKMFDKKLV